MRQISVLSAAMLLVIGGPLLAQAPSPEPLPGGKPVVTVNGTGDRTGRAATATTTVNPAPTINGTGDRTGTANNVSLPPEASVAVAAPEQLPAAEAADTPAATHAADTPAATHTPPSATPSKPRRHKHKRHHPHKIVHKGTGDRHAAAGTTLSGQR